MSKTGRNEPCHCGSGKKYKNCHWTSDTTGTASAPPPPKPSSQQPTFKEMTQGFRAAPILKFIAYLQTLPENHGHNFSLEIMAREVMKASEKNDQRPYMPWRQLLLAIMRGHAYDGETPINLFTENAVSTNGNQVIFPGVYRNASPILNELLQVILTGKNSLPEDFKRLIYSSSGLLLYMSNQVAEDLGYPRYITGNLSSKIVLPGHEEFIKNSQALIFSEDYLTKIAGLYNYDLSVLNNFLLTTDEPKLKDDDPDDNIVSLKPIIRDQDNIILFMPTTVASSLIGFVHEQAIVYGCQDALMKMIFHEQNHRASLTLNHMGWAFTDIQLPKESSGLPILESVWQFDNQKFGYLCLLDTNKINGILTKEEQGKLLNARNTEVIEHLKSLEDAAIFEVLSLFVLTETGHGSYFSMSKPENGEQNLVMTLEDLNTIAYDRESDFLTLWKFANIHKETSSQFHIMNMTGLLNLYAVYRNNDGSLISSDDAHPIGAMLTYLPGHDISLRHEVKISRDEHLGELITPSGIHAFATVIKKREYAPIYGFKDKLSPEYRLMLKCYKMPIWVTNYQKDPNLLASEIAEALLFWLYRLEPHLSPELNKHSLVQLELELIIDEGLLNGNTFVIKTVEPSDVKITTSIVPPKLRLHIPYDFMYLTGRTDNIGEKMLVKAALHGLIDYFGKAGKEFVLTAEQIELMVESELQPDNAKMILFTDASVNIELDGRHLPPEQYIAEVDTSYVLDNLVGLLPAGTVIPENITDISEKISLCDAIVSALIAELTRRIADFDAKELITWLIKWNERCVYTREIREIRTPAKIACFASFEDEVNEINDKDGKLVPTAHSIRTLIEFVTAISPKGKKWPNYADIGILLALTYQLTTWGSISEAMRMGLIDPKIGLLPSGRIGTDKSFQNEVLVPYSYARNRGVVARYVERFDEKYTQKDYSASGTTEESLVVDAAFEDEFGITLTEVSEVVGVLINYGFKREEPCSVLPEEKLYQLLKSELPNRDEARLLKTVKTMTLIGRKGIGSAPSGYTSKDIFPWRYGRNLSYLRRPLALVADDSGNRYFLFGFRHLKSYIDNLLFLIFTGKLPETNSEKMGSFIGTVLHDKGTPYRNEIADWLKDNTDLEVIGYEVKIQPNGHIPAEKNYGDVDVMAVDHVEKIVYSLECKNIIGARNIHEMKVELDLYLGREGQEAKAKINKHVGRDTYLQDHPELITEFLKLKEDGYKVISIVVASDEMPMTYIAKESLPLPVISFNQLKEKGKDALRNK
ncbi:YecA family protein [Nubsella zeaxanthinifaciens]|uniref:YecA family protein n=1 Tax=Nubsella zeaxanthinifaciens TaxID=392412 RepID=UPI003CFD9E83